MPAIVSPGGGRENLTNFTHRIRKSHLSADGFGRILGTGTTRSGERKLRSVLISGASRGLGAALASAFAGRGDRVFSGVRTPRAGIAGDIPLNVRCLDSVGAAVAQVAAAAGGIDILINNAGVHLAGALAALEQDDFKATLDVNLLGAWRLTKAALPHMRAGGTIVMISSLSGLVGLPGDGAYAASKFALEGMSQSLAAEVAPLGLRVLVFEPGRIATGFAGVDNGDTPKDVAETIAARVDRADAPFRNPLGETARAVTAQLGLDDGRRAEAVVAAVTGRGWAQRDA